MGACLLAIDTASDEMALALVTPQGQSHTWLEPGGALASGRLLPALARLMSDAGLAWSALDAIAFGAGPGAFTGLRTACSVAQGLALGLDRPVLPIDSLMVVADDARSQADQAEAAVGRWWAAVDARMDEIYAAQYQWETSGWQTLQAPALYAWPALARLWQAAPPGRVAGNALTVFSQRLPLLTTQGWPQMHDRASALLRLARAAWQQGAATEAAQALPVYLRDKVALTTAERAAGHGRS